MKPQKHRVPFWWDYLVFGLPYVAGVVAGLAGSLWWLFLTGPLCLLGFLAMHRFRVVIDDLQWEVERAQRQEWWAKRRADHWYDAYMRHFLGWRYDRAREEGDRS